MGNLSQEELERKVSQMDYELYLVRREIGLTDSRWANLVSKMMSKIEPVKVRVERNKEYLDREKERLINQMRPPVETTNQDIVRQIEETWDDTHVTFKEKTKNIAETLTGANPYFYTKKPKQTLAQTWDQMWETGPMEEKQELLDRAVGYLKKFQREVPMPETAPPNPMPQDLKDSIKKHPDWYPLHWREVSPTLEQEIGKNLEKEQWDSQDSVQLRKLMGEQVYQQNPTLEQEIGLSAQPQGMNLSSVTTNGPVQKPYPLQSASQDSWQQHIRVAIMESFKSMPSTAILCTETCPDSSTLVLTFKSHSNYGQSMDGNPGHVSPN